MMLWLSVMLVPLIGGGVVGLVLQQYRLQKTRAATHRVATKFLRLEGTHHLLHDAEVAATSRLLAPTDPESLRQLRAADVAAVGSLRGLEAVVGPSQRPVVRHAAGLWRRANAVASAPRLRPADDDEVRALHLDVFDAQDTLDSLTDPFAAEVHNSARPRATSARRACSSRCRSS
jgi:hypothetical protein